MPSRTGSFKKKQLEVRFEKRSRQSSRGLRFVAGVVLHHVWSSCTTSSCYADLWLLRIVFSREAAPFLRRYHRLTYVVACASPPERGADQMTPTSRPLRNCEMSFSRTCAFRFAKKQRGALRNFYRYRIRRELQGELQGEHTTHQTCVTRQEHVQLSE